MRKGKIKLEKNPSGKRQTNLRNWFVIFSAALFLIILVAGSVAFIFSMRTINRNNKGTELTKMLEVQRLLLESSLNSDIYLALKLADSPFIKRYFADPSGAGNITSREISSFISEIAMEEISSFRRFFSEGLSIFWISDTDRMFYIDDLEPYWVDADSPDNYWYNMTLYETEVYNFNINYNPDIHVINLWINAPVFDNAHKPIGMVGSGIDLSMFVNKVYQNVDEKTDLYFFNGLSEITGAEDIKLVSNKVDIMDELSDKGVDIFAEANRLASGETRTFDTPDGKLAIGTVPLLGWYMVAFMADSIGDYKTAMTALFLVVLALMLLIFIIFNLAIARYLKSLRETMESLKVASEAKSNFVANMSHEMRTPMNVIVGLTDLMLEEDDVSGKIKKNLKKINTAGTTLMGLINDVLDISKVEAGKLDLMLVQYDVPSLLNDIITLNIIRIEDKPITFKLDINEELPTTLLGDDLRVKQILNNFLSNAFKYTKKGSVTMTVSHRRDYNYIWLSFSISDTGIGIRKEDMEKLFTDYNQVDTKANRKIEGTGLGLSITKKLVDLMNGEISVESEYGKGTVFHASIRQGYVTDTPIGKETAENLRDLHYSDEKKLADKKLVRKDLSYVKVLVVDDFPTNLDVAAGMLRKYKMQVDCVLSGQEAIDRVTAGEPVYNAIFMDHMMPGMDGIEAARIIRALGTKYAREIPIIALTANAIAGNEQMFLENGFNAFLPKPFNTMLLHVIIEKWLRDKSRE
jgi:signal transduction histidine kinase/CheY-like chemotaxis protein